MNDFIELIKKRRSIRKYKPDPVPMDKIRRIAEAATYAPTGKNWQSPVIVAVTNRELRDRLSRMNARILGVDYDPFFGAPAVLAVLADRQYPTYLYDGSVVMATLMLAAYSEGLASCWIHRAREEFESDEGRAILGELGLKGDYQGIGHCILGYPDCEYPTPAPRKSDYIIYAQ